MQTVNSQALANPKDYLDLDQYKFMLNTPYEGIMFIDAQGIIRYVNQALKYYTGLSDDDLLNTPLSIHNLDNALLDTLQTGKPDLLSYYPEAKLIVSRQPVFRNGKVFGAWGRYVALNMYILKKNIMDRDDFIRLMSNIKIRDIMFQTSRIIAELNSYREEFERNSIATTDLDSIIGKTQKPFKDMVLKIACSPSTVLITGESGTGKELYAQAVHFHSDRANLPFVKVNCAAIPDNLLESELFGYVDGAFTGARKGGKMGKFELADRGTIFLDEIGDMPWAMQAKLLRVLQEGEIERIGDTKPIRVNVRIISATNTHLQHKVDTGKFRHDLFYRLNVVHFHIPPLRERKGDIIDIAEHIIQKLNSKLNQTILGISPSARVLLMSYDWPGNVRELSNVLETTMNFCQGPYIMPGDLPLFFHQQVNHQQDSMLNLQATLARVEKQTIVQALNATGNNREQAASQLGISRTTLYRLMKKHELL